MCLIKLSVEDKLFNRQVKATVCVTSYAGLGSYSSIVA